MDKKTRPRTTYAANKRLQIKRHTPTKRKGIGKDIALNDLEGIALNEINQKDKYHDFTYIDFSKEQNKRK